MYIRSDGLKSGLTYTASRLWHILGTDIGKILYWKKVLEPSLEKFVTGKSIRIGIV